MSGTDNFVDFLRALHSRTPEDYGIEIRRIPGNGYPTPLAKLQEPPDLTTADYYHSVLPRRLSDGVSDKGYLIWCDTDGSQDDPTTFVPAATAILHSGRVNGYHLYWKLDAPHDPEYIEAVCKLATVALKGDFQVCQHRLTFRAPFSVNTKYTPPRPVKVIHVDWSIEYSLPDLEEQLIAACVAPHYIDGARHQLTMALAALLARAEWSLDRAINVIRYLYQMNPGLDEKGKILDCRSTFQRHSLGQPISSIVLRTALGETLYDKFVEALGITQRDGDILINGEVVGKIRNIERDLSAYLLATEDWSSSSGRLVQWQPDQQYWLAAEETTFTSEIFKILAETKVVMQGELVDLPATAKTASAIKAVSVGQLIKTPLPDADPTLLPFNNGTLNLKTLQLIPPIKEHYHIWRIPIDYDESAVSHHWLNFIHEAAPNEEIRRHLQDWFGYCLMVGNPWERLLWLYGPQGTGKSTFLKALALILGPAVSAINADNIGEYNIAQLAFSRVAICSELSPKLLRTSTIKAIVSGDAIQARHPYGRPFTAKFTGKMVWSSNELPTMDQGEGMWRRIVPIEFRTTPTTVIHRLEEYLQQESPGILNWAIEGLRRIQREWEIDGPWTLPQDVQSTVESYRRASNPMATFALEELRLDDPTKHVLVLEVYQRWSVWAKERGLYVRPLDPVFFQELARFGLVVDPVYVNGQRPGLYLRGGTLREGVWGMVNPTASMN